MNEPRKGFGDTLHRIFFILPCLWCILFPGTTSYPSALYYSNLVMRVTALHDMLLVARIEDVVLFLREEAVFVAAVEYRDRLRIVEDVGLGLDAR